jgi:hypothetical protein
LDVIYLDKTRDFIVALYLRIFNTLISVGECNVLTNLFKINGMQHSIFRKDTTEFIKINDFLLNSKINDC